MVKIKVTEDHIKNGERGAISSCPIALATNAVFNGKYFCSVNPAYEDGKAFGEILVYSSEYTLKDGGQVFLFQFESPEFVKFIQDFDGGFDVEPFEFDVEDMTIEDGVLTDASQSQ